MPVSVALNSIESHYFYVTVIIQSGKVLGIITLSLNVPWWPCLTCLIRHLSLLVAKPVCQSPAPLKLQP